MSGKSASVRRVGAELTRVVEITNMLRETDDPELLLGMIEGETDIAEAIAAVYEEMLEDEVMISGLKQTIEQLRERKGRLERSNEVRRTVILSAMEKSGLTTIKTPLATITKKSTPPNVVVTDEAAIPSAYWKVGDPQLDKLAVAAALKDKQAVPGAMLSNGGITLSIRKL